MLHNELHRTTDLQSAYRAALGEDNAEFSGIERAGETLTPIIDLWSLPEWSYLRREYRFWMQQTAAAVAAERSILCLRNPVDSGVIAVVTKARALADCTVRFSTNQAQVADATNNGFSRDGRHAVSGAGNDLRSRVQFITMTETTANSGTTVWEMTLANDSQRILELDFVLPPGRDLRLVGILDLTALGGGFWWRERVARAGELES